VWIGVPVGVGWGSCAVDCVGIGMRGLVGCVGWVMCEISVGCGRCAVECGLGKCEVGCVGWVRCEIGVGWGSCAVECWSRCEVDWVGLS